MALQFFGGKITVSGTASSLDTLLSFSQRKFYKELAVRADTSNVGRIWFGRSNVTVGNNQLGFLDPGDAVGFAPSEGWVSTDQIYWIGDTPGDVAYVTVVE